MGAHFTLNQDEELVHKVKLVSINFKTWVQDLTFELEITELKVLKNDMILLFFTVVMFLWNKLGSNNLISFLFKQWHKIEWVIVISLNRLSLNQYFDSNVFEVKLRFIVNLLFLPCKLELFYLIA